MLALFVMLFAVVPHLALAASPMAATLMAVQAMPAPGTTMAGSPCHERTADLSHPLRLPACCMIGCAVLAEAPTTALPFRALAWSPPQPSEQRLLSGISREPSKPPPRRELVRL